MNDIKPLVIDRRDKTKGLHTYCGKCKRLTTTRVCGKTGKRISSCKSPEFHKFKIIKSVPGTDSKKKRVKILETRDINEAIREKIIFEQELELNGFQKTDVIIDNSEAKPRLLIECMAMYIGYLNNEGVESHKRKDRTKGHIEDVGRSFRYLCESLVKNGLDHTIFEVVSINSKVVALVHDYLLDYKGFANTTYNGHIAILRQFVTWLIEQKNYTIKNPFKEVVRKASPTHDNEVLEYEEFNKLLDVIRPENGIKEFSTGERKNMYRDWVKNAFIIALETGLRREEFMTIKYSDIILDNRKEPKFIRVENYKVNRAKGIKESNSKQYKLVPVTENMKRILYELEQKVFQGTDFFVIGREEVSSRKTLMDKVSKAFTHFWKITGIQKDVQLKNLRKTYLTALANHFGDNANLISDHASMEVLKKHYINNKKMVEKASDFSVFNWVKS